MGGGMQMGMDQVEFERFFERMSATTIANQATIRCLLLGVPPTPENITYFVGDFFDPENPEFAGLVERIAVAIDELVCRALPTIQHS